MTQSQIAAVVKRQRDFYATGATASVDFRMDALKRLERLVKEHQGGFAQALAQDLGKEASEAYFCETGMVLSEIRWLRNHLRRLCRDRRVPTPLAQFPARSYQRPSPLGVCLVMSPWNYPVMLALEPVADAIAGGNTVVLKPSAYSPATSALLKKLLEEAFPPEYLTVIPGGREENQALLEEPFDHIFFTGSKRVGKLVMEKAAAHLTPVTLELGGKSPCIVHPSADLALAARRIVFGKFLNCGQTCVAPDYVLCHSSIREPLLEALKAEIQRQYPHNTGKIISEKHFHRLCRLIDQEKVVWGGNWEKESLQIQPTILSGVSWEDPVMEEEIFGPILPVLTYETVEEVIAQVNTREKPLALYCFAGDKKVADRIMTQCAFGGGCVNDTIIHLATSAMGFGGVGESGMGAYHGKAGFDTFTHKKSVVDKKTWLDLPMRYRPYEPWKDRLIRLFLR